MEFTEELLEKLEKLKNEAEELIEERDLLAYENKAMANFISYLYETGRTDKNVETVIFQYKEMNKVCRRRS